MNSCYCQWVFLAFLSTRAYTSTGRCAHVLAAVRNKGVHSLVYIVLLSESMPGVLKQTSPVFSHAYTALEHVHMSVL